VSRDRRRSRGCSIRHGSLQPMSSSTAPESAYGGGLAFDRRWNVSRRSSPRWARRRQSGRDPGTGGGRHGRRPTELLPRRPHVPRRARPWVREAAEAKDGSWRSSRTSRGPSSGWARSRRPGDARGATRSSPRARSRTSRRTRRVFVDYDHLLDDMKPGERVLLADGLIHLVAERWKGDHLVAESCRAGSSATARAWHSPIRTCGCLPSPRRTGGPRVRPEIGVDYVAASFVRTGATSARSANWPAVPRHRQDRTGARVSEPRRHPHRGGGRDGRPGRPRGAAPARAHSPGPGRHHRPHECRRPGVDHRHRDARVDDQVPSPDPGRGHRRRQPPC
jgi:hypothetical protein